MRLLLATALGLSATAQEPPPQPPAQQPTVASRQFAVPLHDGRLQVDELVRALLAEYQLDGAGLALPAARIDLRDARGALLLYGGRKLLLDTVRFRRDLRGGRLLVIIDRERTREVRRELRARLARFVGRLAGESVEQRRYELVLPLACDPARPLCVLVHGVDSGPAVFDELRAFLEQPPHACQVATFAYPDDEALERVAPVLAGRLRSSGDQPVALVGHSFGGLIARAVVEDPALDPGNVRTLVLLGTPNQGSGLAGFRFALELADVLREVDGERRFAEELLEAVIDHWRDGLGEAGGDLLPGSVCLERLSRRERNPNVRYHVVLGTRSVLQPGQLAAVRDAVRARLAAAELGQVVRPRLEAWLDGLDELVDAKGDGAVSVVRGALPGVEPVLVPLDHVGLVRRRGLLGAVRPGEPHPVFELVRQWLQEQP